MFIMLKKGCEKINNYIKELEAKRKEILDAQKDTAENIHLPSAAEIREEADILFDGSQIIELMYDVTDHYEADRPLILEQSTDFIIKETEN